MFTKEISSITLANEIADRLFDNITASHYCMDKTFTATLRAVLHGRLLAGESLHLALVPLGYGAVTPDTIAASIRQHDVNHSYTIYIVYSQDKQLGDQMLNIVRSSFGNGKQYFDTYALQEDLRMFYIKMLNGLFYTNGFSAIIFLETLDMRRFHALQMMIPKYLPRLFAENPLTEIEAALLKSLGGRGHTEYERLIEQFAQRFDMRGEIIRTRLKGFETVFERERMQQVTQAIATYEREYQMYLTNLRDKLNMIQEQQIILAGLQCQIDGADNDSELMEYFLCNKQLSIIRVHGTELEFVVHGYADIYDEEAFETYAGNLNSYLYNQLGNGVTREEMERLYRAVFGDGNYKLRLCAAYRADMRNAIKPVMDYIFPPESQTYLPNPHIQSYGCIGGYASRFVEYMQKRDYVGAIDQAAVSARNLNFYDSAVMSAFAKNLSRTAIKCIEDMDGNLMTPREVIKKLTEVPVCQSPSE